MPATAQENKDGVITGIIGTSLGVGLVYCGYHYLPIAPPRVTHPSDHLLYAIKCQLPMIVFLVVSVMRVLMGRMAFGAMHALQPARDKEHAENFEVRRRIVENSVQQFVIAAPAQWILALYLAPAQLKMIPALVVHWVVSRIVYSHGYLRDTKDRLGRGLGFNMIFNIQMFLVGYLVYRYVTEFMSATQGVSGLPVNPGMPGMPGKPGM